MGRKRKRKKNSQARVTADNYRGASRGLRSMRNYVPPLLSPTQELSEGTRLEMTARSRELDKNSPLGRACLDRPTEHTVGRGLRLKAKPNALLLGMDPDRAEEFARAVEAHFNLYASTSDIDVLRTSNFAELQSVAMSTAFVSGDCFGLTPEHDFHGSPYKIKLQLVEGEQISNPGVQINSDYLKDGIEIDDNGTPVFYHVREGYPTDYLEGKNYTWKAVPVFGERTGLRRAFHVYTRKRPGQYRGEVLLAPVIEKIHQSTQLDRAEITASLINAIYTVFRRVDQPEDDPNTLINAQGTSNIPELPPLGSGLMADLFGEEKLEFADPTRPNVNYMDFFAGITKQTGAALGIPVEEILLKYDSSYSAARAAMLRAYMWYARRRKWLSDRLLTPFYRVWFTESVTIGAIKAPGYFSDPIKRLAYTECEWIGPAKGHVDEEKEAKAAKIRVSMGLTTLEHECAQLGYDFWSEIFPKIKREREALGELGITIDNSFGNYGNVESETQNA